MPAAVTELEHFYRVGLEPEQLALETGRLGGLWSDFTLHFGQAGQVPRPPVKALSQWHLALALALAFAAGAISGVVTSPNGRVLVIKRDAYKEKISRTEFTELDATVTLTTAHKAMGLEWNFVGLYDDFSADPLTPEIDRANRDDELNLL